MTLQDLLIQRSVDKCEICTAESALQAFTVMPVTGNIEDSTILICETCLSQIEKRTAADTGHWSKALQGSIWSEVPGVQVISWRMLNRLKDQSWAADSLEMMYMDEERLAWAKAADTEEVAKEEFHQDSNGLPLLSGDTIVLTRSLDVKGSQLNARMGTVVKNIRLVNDNTEQIEGKIEGQTIVILTKYVRKHNS